jgi:hypothetical protein
MIIMDARTSQQTPLTHKPRRARVRRHHGAPWADRQLGATDAVVRFGSIDRQLVHPIGGLEGYSPAEVLAEQIRARDADRPEAVTGYLSVAS